MGGGAERNREKRFLLANIAMKSLRYGFRMVFCKIELCVRDGEREREREDTKIVAVKFLP